MWILAKLRLYTKKQRQLYTASLLKELGALPIRSIIRIDEQGKLVINERPVDMAMARSLKTSAQAALDNPALNLALEQITFAAVVSGVHKGNTADDSIMFSKTALWNIQQLKETLHMLAQDEESLL